VPACGVMKCGKCARCAKRYGRRVAWYVAQRWWWQAQAVTIERVQNGAAARCGGSSVTAHVPPEMPGMVPSIHAVCRARRDVVPSAFLLARTHVRTDREVAGKEKGRREVFIPV